MGRLTDEEQAASLKEQAERRAEVEVAALNPRPLVVDAAAVERRKAIAAELLSYYEFLTSMYLPDDALKTPPAEGWDIVNAERFAFLGKTDIVLDLYKHIPYIERDVEIDYFIARATSCMDYTGKYFADTGLRSRSASSVEPYEPDWHDGPAWDRLRQPEHIAVLADCVQSRNGFYIAVDMRDGAAARLRPLNGEDSPAATYYNSLHELLNELRQNLINLELIPIDPHDIISYTEDGCPDSHYAADMQELYRRHGWPGNFKKYACLRQVQQMEQAYREKRREMMTAPTNW